MSQHSGRTRVAAQTGRFSSQISNRLTPSRLRLFGLAGEGVDGWMGWGDIAVYGCFSAISLSTDCFRWSGRTRHCPHSCRQSAEDITDMTGTAVGGEICSVIKRECKTPTPRGLTRLAPVAKTTQTMVAKSRPESIAATNLYSDGALLRICLASRLVG